MSLTHEQSVQSWHMFHETSRTGEEVRPVIAESWKRCKAVGVDPWKESGDLVSPEELEARLAARKTLVSIARPLMESIYSIIKSSVYSIVLSDQEGVILHVVLNEHIEPHSKKINFVVGAKWDEWSVGTNAMGTALAEDKPIQIVGGEHYCRAHHAWTCSAAPIHDSSGAVIGCLDLSGKAEDDHIHTFGIAVSAAKSIEEQLSIMETDQLMNTVFDSILDGLMIIDNHFRIKKTNSRLASILMLNPEELLDLDARSLLKDTEVEETVLKHGGSLNYPDCTLKVKRNRIDCMLRVFPYEFDGGVQGAVLLVREAGQVRKEVNQLAGFKASYCFDDIITRHPAMLEIISFAKRIAGTNCTVLIEGESGTGKELFAQSIHSESGRSDGPFIAVNCAALPHDLVESELFGYERGAFTGALREGSPGKFELADGGTIFLDEIGELPLEIQAKLLRVLDNHKVRRIGGKHERSLDVRVIAATNRNLAEEVARKSYRSDLYYRLNVISLRLLPLRERTVDIPELAEWFLKVLNRDNAGPAKSMSPAFREALAAIDWPGNVRELQNAVQRAFYLSEGTLLAPSGLAMPPRTSAPVPLPGKSLQQLEEESIRMALAECAGSAASAARLLGISRSSIYRKAKEYGIPL